ncbi:hypothetical protein CWI37_0687p0010 [Hamiltosporidium tvaerminnensis]|uniref:Uncharacterized protein n=1 Tax=Hamiltosporidium tvaerminnensis TaxID=1176355 RepID=A0A4Q9L295_9MICR|nr:hypothetical protein CWI37_0687p0010 [Hamiltosporidium tvaerminnensis]
MVKKILKLVKESTNSFVFGFLIEMVKKRKIIKNRSIKYVTTRWTHNGFDFASYTFISGVSRIFIDKIGTLRYPIFNVFFCSFFANTALNLKYGFVYATKKGIYGSFYAIFIDKFSRKIKNALQ